jgi:hypothetical protein
LIPSNAWRKPGRLGRIDSIATYPRRTRIAAWSSGGIGSVWSIWGFVHQQNIERFRRQIAESLDPFRRARLQALLDEELSNGHSPAPTELVLPAVRTGTAKELRENENELEHC